MIDVYYWTTPNGHKITMFLEEAGLEYNVKPVNIGKGEQFEAAFLAISPNNKMPAIVDHAPAGRGARVAHVADGGPGAHAGAEPPLLDLRAGKDPLRDRPLREGDLAPLRGAEQAARGARLHPGKALQHRRHRVLSLDHPRPPGPGHGRIPEPAALARGDQGAALDGARVRDREAGEPEPRRHSHGRRKEDPVRAGQVGGE